MEQLDLRQDNLARLFGWIAAHPCVSDVDEAAERILGALTRFADTGNGHADSDDLIDLLNQLLDTVGNCETEERHLKSELWSQIALRAAEAGVSLNAHFKGES